MMAVWIGTSVNVSMEPRALETNAKVPVQASAQRKGPPSWEKRGPRFGCSSKLLRCPYPTDRSSGFGYL